LDLVIQSLPNSGALLATKEPPQPYQVGRCEPFVTKISNSGEQL